MTTTTSSKDWHILRNTGQRLTFQGLVKLQELIANNEVTAEDLLSRDGRKWKRLSDIAELGGIFAEAARRRSMPFGSYQGPPQTMLMPTAVPRPSNSPPATLTMPTHLERPSLSPSQLAPEGRDMEFTSKSGRVAPKDVPPQTLSAVSKAPVVLSEHRPASSPSAIKGVQGFHVREEPSRYLETPKLPFATTAPPEARERLAAATPVAMKVAKTPEDPFDHYPPQTRPANTEGWPQASSAEAAQQAVTRAPVLMSPSGRFPALNRPSQSPSGSYQPRTNPSEPSFPARPASPQIPEGPKVPSGVFPSHRRPLSGSYRVAETHEPQPEAPLSTLRFHSAAEAQSGAAPSTLKLGAEKNHVAEAPLATARSASGRFPVALSSMASGPHQAARSAEHPEGAESERTETLRFGVGQGVDPTATIPQMPSFALSGVEDEKQKTTLQGVGSVPSRRKIIEEPPAPYFSDSPISLGGAPDDDEPKTEQLRANPVPTKSGELRVDRDKEPADESTKPPNPPVIRSLSSSPLFEKRPSRSDVEPEPVAPAPVAPKPPAPEEDWRLGAAKQPEEDDPPFVPVKKKTSALPWVVGGLAALLVSLFLAKPTFLFGPKTEALSPKVAPSVAAPAVSRQQQLTSEGEALLLLDDDESLKKSQALFLKALGAEESYAPALRGLLLSYTILAVRVEQEQLLETKRLGLLSKEEAAKLQVLLEADQKKREQGALFAEAAQYAEKLSALPAPQPELATQAALGEFQFATNDKGLPSTLSMVSKFPGSWQENWLLALMASRKDAAKAKQLLSAVISQQPGLLRARYQLAVLLLQENSIPAARQEAEIILAQNPRHTRAALLLERWSESVPAPETTPSEPAPAPAEPSNKGPQTASEWVQEGDRKMKSNKTSDALDAYLEAANQDRGHLPAYLKAGDAYMKLKRPDYACSQYQSALTINPENADAIFGFASCSSQMGNSREAQKRFEQYLSLYPQGAKAAAAQKRLDELTEKKTPTSAPAP